MGRAQDGGVMGLARDGQIVDKLSFTLAQGTVFRAKHGLTDVVFRRSAHRVVCTINLCGNLRIREEYAVIRLCTREDCDAIYAIVNDAARVYQGVIPGDRWKEPYMSMEELAHELQAGVRFWGHEQDGELDAVMGTQAVKDVTLIRHAYVRPSAQRRGIGGQLLSRLRNETDGVVLVGTWADATWAIRFYQRHGFRLVDTATKNGLLRTYWSIPARQIEESVALTDAPST